MMPELELAALLQPLPGVEPCGPSLLHDPAFDAIRAARRADDPSLPAGVWQTELKVADWQAVETHCVDILRNRSKDLTIAAWLGEAWLQRYGVPALPRCFELIAGLCERFWDGVHPLPRDGDAGFRAAPLAWLVTAYADLLSVQIELFEGRDGLRGTLAQWQAAQRAQLAASSRQNVPPAQREAATRTVTVLQEAARAASPVALRHAHESLSTARLLIELLDAWCTPRLGNEAPSFSTLLETMTQAGLVLTECLAMHPNSEPPRAVPASDAERTAAAPGQQQSSAAAGVPGMPQSREDAYRQLATIADYLMRYEPHSPVPYMIQRALEWGGKPLPVLLRELMSSEADGQKLWTVLGLLPGAEKTK
ncbi:type VI secretion system protein TssA [Trinickia violacea]|uniref:Type VI secretion system protein TssA n=1 Tax=Trinickia violacea TaxID=2571746 RepID=A0A4P8IWF4_9BURK|nr:type VI secretion system protein TssA [Trinickia violacea]QCP53542.1 type VI secretion system protein TssA [Trinickia violacea]